MGRAFAPSSLNAGCQFFQSVSPLVGITFRDPFLTGQIQKSCNAPPALLELNLRGESAPKKAAFFLSGENVVSCMFFQSFACGAIYF